MSSRWWPLWDVRLRTGDLELRPMAEADLPIVAGVLPDDVELDPGATRFSGLDERTWRGTVVHQEYARATGTWSPDGWQVFFVVRRGADVLGLQGLEGPDFRKLRTVDTSSWLVSAARGRGVGTAMRRAVLALAFDHLGALAAVTSAWHDNHASLGVSRAVGYRPNGESLQARDGAPDTLVHMRLTRDEWTAAGPSGVRVEGLAAALPLFDLPD